MWPSGRHHAYKRLSHGGRMRFRNLLVDAQLTPAAQFYRRCFFNVSREQYGKLFLNICRVCLVVYYDNR
jgi:hypothetical protein